MVQWLRLHVSNAGGAGSILVEELKSPRALGVAKKKKITVYLQFHISWYICIPYQAFPYVFKNPL